MEHEQLGLSNFSKIRTFLVSVDMILKSISYIKNVLSGKMNKMSDFCAPGLNIHIMTLRKSPPNNKTWFCNYQLINFPACIIGLWCSLYICRAREKRQEIFPITAMIAAENVQRLLWKPLSNDHNDCSDNDRWDRLNFYHVETDGRLVNTSNGLPLV